MAPARAPAVRSVASVVSDSNFFGIMDLWKTKKCVEKVRKEQIKDKSNCKSSQSQHCHSLQQQDL